MIAALLLLWVCAAGTLLARRLDPASSRLGDALALGAPIGMAVLAMFGFILGWAFGLTPATVAAAAALTMGTGLALGAAPATVFAPAPLRPGLGAAILALLSALLVARVADRVLMETSAGIATGARHNFGDLPFHMAIAAGFAYGDNFPPDHPELAGVPLTYPFFCDLIAGMILVSGGSWRDAVFWPTLILGLSVVVALVRFGESITRSRTHGRMAAALTLFSGGLGFSILRDGQHLAAWWAVGPDLTINDAGQRYANFVITLFIPQRSILFGWPLLFFALALQVESLRTTGNEEAAQARDAWWRRAGLIGSVLPLVHSHSFAVLWFCAVFLVGKAGIKSALAFAQGILPLALPAIIFMAMRNSLATGKFLEWQPGFDGGAPNPLAFWLMNAGLFLPLSALGIFQSRSVPSRVFLAAPFVSLFVLANMFKLSPWIWDNMKFLAPAHAGLAPFAALALAHAWKEGRPGKTVAALAFVAATLSGALDVTKVACAGGEFEIFDRDGMAFAYRVRAQTAPSATILTAPTHNHPVLLSGRRLFLGYEGHLWSQGLIYKDREAVAAGMFRGESQPTESVRLTRIAAIAITPAEASHVPDPDVLQGLPSLINSPYRLLKVR